MSFAGERRGKDGRPAEQKLDGLIEKNFPGGSEWKRTLGFMFGIHLQLEKTCDRAKRGEMNEGEQGNSSEEGGVLSSIIVPGKSHQCGLTKRENRGEEALPGERERLLSFGQEPAPSPSRAPKAGAKQPSWAVHVRRKKRRCLRGRKGSSSKHCVGRQNKILKKKKKKKEFESRGKKGPCSWRSAGHGGRNWGPRKDVFEKKNSARGKERGRNHIISEGGVGLKLEENRRPGGWSCGKEVRKENGPGFGAHSSGPKGGRTREQTGAAKT